MVLGMTGKRHSRPLECPTPEPPLPQPQPQPSPPPQQQPELTAAPPPAPHSGLKAWWHEHVLHHQDKQRQKKLNVLLILYYIIGILLSCVAVALVASSVLGAVVLRPVAEVQLARLVSLVLAILAGFLIIALFIYTVLAGTKLRYIPFYIGSGVYAALALLLLVLCCATLRFGEGEPAGLTAAVGNISRQDTYRHATLWPQMQNSLQCCGVYGPDDYRRGSGSPLQVPVSCCPSYDLARSESSQETKRYACIFDETYYRVGCGNQLINSVQTSATTVTIIAALCVILMTILAIMAHWIGRLKNDIADDDRESVNVGALVDAVVGAVVGTQQPAPAHTHTHPHTHTAPPTPTPTPC